MQPGEQLPGEHELLAEYGVARGTARQAIMVLRNEGLIEAVHGLGSFVREPEPIERLRRAARRDPGGCSGPERRHAGGRGRAGGDAQGADGAAGDLLLLRELGARPEHPVIGVRKPNAKRQRAVTPPSPALVERMRGELLAAGQVRDATLVSVLAYAGLRPQKTLGLPWSNVRGRTLLIDRAHRATRA